MFSDQAQGGRARSQPGVLLIAAAYAGVLYGTHQPAALTVPEDAIDASHPPDRHPDAPVPPKPGRPAPKPWQTTPQAQCALGVRMAGIGLAAAIEELRQELYRAQDLGADQQFAFGIEEAELELQLELRNSGKGDGKVSFGVATVGAGGEHSTVRTHRLTLKLSVRDRARGGSSPEIGDTETGSWGEE